MNAQQSVARSHGCRRLRVITTGDNADAHRFYEHLGYSVVERRVGAVDEARRRYKPTIAPDAHDEIEFGLLL